MKYCSVCATPVEFSVPADDNMPRYHCPACGTIHYQNPRVIVGTLPVLDGQLLLCKRNIEPRFGLWTLPGGFMENGETLQEGAARETWEEARNAPDLQQMLSVISLPQFDQVHVYYLAAMTSPEFSETAESSEVRLFRPTDIPWDQIAFRTVLATLQHYVDHLSPEGTAPASLPLLETTIMPMPRN
ncbi:MAG: NUDIX hydrolase [Natronospirillum sp.]|uniref:NUDIX hydrolase n=1 Tax=Natronospirillum sp. TaxID=2812955 RepID=UPI0025EAA131|nr:NUDIX hydrolase [Natronospirillum sp.]MCH8553181.1 NUDIX hydrolase [Natronospirillum sp.]